MKNPKKYFEGFLSGVSRISRVWGRHSPTRFPQGQNERKANFGTAVESCSKTAADCPCRVFPYIERTGQGFWPAVGRPFSLSAKDTFQRPPATRWTGIFQNFFCLSNPGNRILATGGAENFPFHSPHHRVLKFAKRNGQFSLCFLLRTKIKNAKRWGRKISPLTYYYNLNRAKWPGTEPGNKKSSKSFSDLLLSLAAPVAAGIQF